MSSPATKHHTIPFLVRARGVTVERQGERILDGVDLTVRPQQIVTLIGPNGAGKTTLVRTLLGLLPPDRGTVEHCPGLRIGYVPQRFALPQSLPLDVDAFLRLVKGSCSTERRHLLALLGINHLIDRPMHALSGGELQRVLLARALLRQPQLLVLDEPAQGLDIHGQQELYALISRLRNEAGCGVLLISHDLHLVMAATDEVVCLERHVCCVGTPEAISRHPEYLRLFGPEWVSLALYRHRHDHRHDLHGVVVPLAHDPQPGKEPR